jgi:hypothetical protein
MNMDRSFSAMDAVVFAALAIVGVMLAAWCASPGLREWMERPKYRFMENVKRNDPR